MPLGSYVVDDDNMPATCLASPSTSDETIRGAVPGPRGLRLELRPRALAKVFGFLQHLQQPGIKFPDVGVHSLDGAAAEMGRYPDPRSLELSLIEEAQTGR